MKTSCYRAGGSSASADRQIKIFGWVQVDAEFRETCQLVRRCNDGMRDR